MRIGNFEVTLELNTVFSPAEIQLEIARIFNSVQIRNVRGSEKDWINFELNVSGKPSPAIPYRVSNLPANNSDREKEESDRVRHTMVLNSPFSTGHYNATIKAFASDPGSTNPIEWKQSYSFDVLSPDMMPVEYDKAACLAAWVCRNNDDLRAYVHKIAPSDLAVEGTIRAIYGDLCKRGLRYQNQIQPTNPNNNQPISGPLHVLEHKGNYQIISGPLYAHKHGGSCVDLSLLFASLLRLHGKNPVLLLFPDHMAVGCFTEKCFPPDETIQGAKDILKLTEDKALLVWDAISVTYSGITFDKSVANLHQERLDQAGSGVCLINVNAVLGNHVNLTFMDPSQQPMMICKDCGHHFPAPYREEDRVCSGCGSTRVVPYKPYAVVPDDLDINMDDYDWRSLKRKPYKDGLEITGFIGEAKELIRIPRVLDGKVILRIGDKAFMNSKTTRFSIPECVTEIGDYAFYGCQNLKEIDFPASLTVLGTAAFARSGLTRVVVPGSVIRLSRLAFSNCEHLSSVLLEEGIRQIDERAFENCPALPPNIRIPSTAKCNGDLHGRH